MIHEIFHLSDAVTDSLMAVVCVAWFVTAAYWMRYFKRGNPPR